ncbi:unnamed protein product [Caenorhabditis auriculariae]|uniref:CNH domain-containing protein n=1 Tax=Caenorhabditis auriculariae TaxID=2777116 RepID=A0A8S1H328_9PELO|nr:unnamed protein product [Caenorhabditis auriculariae]
MFDAYAPSEVALRLPLEITCISYQKSTQSILAGGKSGHLCVYTANPNRKGFKLANVCKTFERSKKPVTEISICEKEDILLCVSDGQLAAHRLHDNLFEVETLLHKVKSVHTYTQFVPKGSSEIYLLVSSKKRLYLFKWGLKDGQKEFLEVQLNYEHTFLDNPTCIRCVNDTMFLAARDEYFLMTLEKISAVDDENESWNSTIRRLMSFQGVPSVVPMLDRQLIAFVRNDIVVTTNFEGERTPKCKEFKFSEALLDLVYDAPYLVALLAKGRVEVRSALNNTRIQTMALNKAMTIVNGHSGHVYVGSAFDIWQLDTSINLRKNVQQLISDREFELAIQLADSSNVFTEDNKVEIKRQAALNLFNQKKFEESFALYSEIKTDVLTIISLFPELLPEQMRRNTFSPDLAANDKLRAMLALGNYLVEVRTDYAKQIESDQRHKASGDRRLTDEEARQLMITLRVVDTTLLKCYLKTKPTLVDSLIRLHNNACAFDDAETILKQERRFSSLFTLYESRKKHDLALELLMEQSRDPEAEPFFEGTDKVVEYLQSLGNSNLPLIFRYAKWVFSKDLEAGVSIFTGDDSELARNLDRRAVVDFLRVECVHAVIPYLEHIIYKWEESEAFYHEVLVEHYVSKVNELFKCYVHAFPDDENMTMAGDEEGDLGRFRKRLLKFLQFSNAYSPQTILLQLTSHAFYEERALILGRLKQHEQALMIYTSILKNLPAAEKYCELYYNRHDEVNSQVYLNYFRALVLPTDSNSPAYLSIDEADVPQTQPDIHSAIKLLSKHADKINTVSALTMLPSDTRLRIVSSALNAVLQTAHDKATSCALQRCVSGCALEKKEAKKRAAEATKILVNTSSECQVCHKKIALSAFVRYTDGSLAHFYCYNDSAPEKLRTLAMPISPP